jgi:hypothetical protein
MMEENPEATVGDVLERLDALLNRDKTASIAKDEIPLLTDIYQPVTTNPTHSTEADLNLTPEHIEQIVQLLLPEMTRVMQEVLAQNIQPALETTLRQRLQALAQRKLNR